jgi:chloramphenicol-sensitive protein RarD
MKNTSYYLAAVAAFTIWGFFSLVLRPLSGYSSLDILFYRVFLSATLMLLVSVFFRRKVWVETRRLIGSMTVRQRRGLALQTLGGGLFLTGNWFSYIYVTNHISIKASAFAYLICPVLTTVLAWMILKEQLTKGQWFAVLLSAAGCIILAFNYPGDLLYGLVIAIFYAFYLVSQRRDAGVDRFLLLTGQVLFSALILLPFYPAYHGPTPQESKFYILIAVMAVFLTIIPLWLNLYALKRLRSSTTGILLYINPVLNFILAMTVFGEKVDTQQAAAYAVIVVGVGLFNWFNPAVRTQIVSKPDRVVAGRSPRG